MITDKFHLRKKKKNIPKSQKVESSFSRELHLKRAMFCPDKYWILVIQLPPPLMHH